MPSAPIADVHITGAGATYFVYALALLIGLVIVVIARTNPRRRVRALSRVEQRIEPWLWHKKRTRAGAILGGAAVVGAIGCVLAGVLPVATYVSYAMYPGDPFAGTQEIEGAVQGLAVAVGVIAGLLSLRRALGGEGVTSLVSFVLMTVLAFITGLAVADVIDQAATGASQYMSAVTTGPGLYALVAGVATGWVACAADIAIGVRQAFGSTSRAAAPPPPPAPPAPRPPAPVTREPIHAHLIAQSIAAAAAFTVLVLAGWLPVAFLLFGLAMIAPSGALQWYLGRRLGRPLRIDRYTVVVVGTSLLGLAAALCWALARPNPVFAVPASGHGIAACGPSVTIPDVGNQVN